VSRGIRILLSTVVVVALLVVGGIAIVTAPDDDGLVAPVGVAGTIGHTVQTRELTAKVTGAALARQLDYPGLDPADVPDSTTAGTWVLIDATVTSRLSEQTLQFSTLTIGGTGFSIEQTVKGGLVHDTLGAGVPVHGTLVFEVSRSALASPGAADARLTLRYSPNQFVDTVPVVRLDLSRLRVESSAPVLVSVVGTR
jgi:hypothetical protein